MDQVTRESVSQCDVTFNIDSLVFFTHQAAIKQKGQIQSVQK